MISWNEWTNSTIQRITMENLMFFITGFVIASIIFIVILYNVIEENKHEN